MQAIRSHRQFCRLKTNCCRLAGCAWGWCWLLLWMLTLSGCVSSQATASSDTPFRNTFETCQLSAPQFGGTIAAECRYLTVYEDRASQSGRQIDLHIAILPAISRTPLSDPLFFITGGPGQGASESYGQVAVAFADINQNRDVVIVDQRGTGRSNPLRCAVPTHLEDVSDPTDDQIRDWLSTCAADLNADPTLYTTSNAVADLEEVRIALGYTQINLYGVSYGTRVALAYADTHPQVVRAMVLDGVVPGDQPVGRDVAANAQQTLDLIMERCRADSACSEAFPDVDIAFAELVEQIQSDAIELSIPHPISGMPTEVILDHQALATVVRLHSYAPETAALLPLLIHSAQINGNYIPLAAQSILVSQQLSDAISLGMNLSVICSEDAPYLDTEEVAEANRKSYYGNFETDRIALFCAVWPRTEVTGEKKPITSDVPALLLSGEMDPVTPPANGERAAQTLANSLHLVAPHQGHAVAIRGCIPRLISEFIDAADPTALKVECVQTLKPFPFFVSFAGPKP